MSQRTCRTLCRTRTCFQDVNQPCDNYQQAAGDMYRRVSDCCSNVQRGLVWVPLMQLWGGGGGTGAWSTGRCWCYLVMQGTYSLAASGWFWVGTLTGFPTAEFICKPGRLWVPAPQQLWSGVVHIIQVVCGSDAASISLLQHLQRGHANQYVVQIWPGQ
jgi:hypothetical protein